MMADAEKAYMQSPLVLWVETFKANDGHPLEYRDLYDGVFLNDVMQQIDPRPAYDGVNRNVEDVSVRLHNWDLLVKNVRGFYRDVLQQLLVLRLPNITTICRDPAKESSFAEIRKALLLVLGCAVQCEHKEDFIDRIMAMDILAQTEIVENIKEVTDDSETVLSIQRPDSPTSCNTYVDKLFHHLHRLIRERDQCAELACDLGQERDYYMSQVEGRPVVDSPQLSPEKHHLALELAECKAKLRHTRQELEDRQEHLSDAKDELRDSMANCAQLKQENASLLQEARATRSLKDELDILKEKASKVDLFEKEILKYKERLNELEFYKARTEELKEDNSILEETKAMLEDQLEGSRKRIETVVELESEMRRYRQQLEEISKERESDKEKLEYLTEENARLEFEKKSSLNESASLESELSAVRSRVGNMGSSLSEQLSETSHARVLRLELENQRLSAQLAEMKESALIHNAEISLEMEKENQRLAKKIEKLQASACESSEQAVRAESELASAWEEKSRLAQALDAFKDNAERQVLCLEKENEQLSQALNNIRERSEKTNDVRVKDLERENKRLHEAVTSKNGELTRLEFEGRQLQRSVHQLDDSKQRMQELEQENQHLEKENSELHQKLGALQHVAERVEVVEQESSDLSIENRKLQRTVESLQAAQAKREELEQDNISLKVEQQRMQRTIENLKVEGERAIELETEKDNLNQQLQQLRKSLDGQKTQKLKQEQMEFELIDMGNEKQRLQKSIEVTTRRLQQLEKDNLDIESENDKLTKELDSLKVTVKRLEEKDKEAGALDIEVGKLQRDKVALEKENRKLKQSSELKESALEELNGKFQALGKESKSLRRSLDKMKETCAKVKDLERENGELMQELNTDRRTLATLREDLVNEKIRSQELSNELEQLNGELEKVGISTQKLTMAEQTNDANRYKALEAMIEDTLKKSSELKDEKIHALEARLEQSKSRNLKLQDELRMAQREKEGLKQRVEEVEEKVQVSPQGSNVRDGNTKERFVRTGSTNATKEILQLKDHLVDLERSNAKLQTESENLRSNNSNLTDQCRRLETQLSNLQSQNASMHGHYSSLKEQDAKLQVEYATLQSQLSSQLSQQEGLKTRHARLEMDHENLQQKHEGLQSTHSSLMSDHDSLQHLHEQLTSEYESLVSEHGSLKSMHKSLKMELKDSQEQLDALLMGKDDVNKLRYNLEQERDQLKRELSGLGNLQGDHARLQEDHSQMKAAYDKLSLDYSQVLHSHKQVKTDYNNLQLKYTELQGELNEAKENMSVADVEFQKLENKVETVYQINERIENENQALLMQIKQLLNQNHDLLTKALNSKDHFAEEEKAYLEKLSDLRRQKERLEEKIMEHYKNRMSPKKKGLGALIARKARGIISRGPRRSKSRNNLHEGLDNSSQGSGSTEHINDSTKRLEKRMNRRANSVEEPPKLANQNKSLAKSSTALHSSLSENEKPVLRGAKSTENLHDALTGDSHLLPGVGRPYIVDGEESQGKRSTTPGLGRRTPGRSSPGSEMLTLDQFLKEANKSPRNENGVQQRRRSNDSESKGSDNSNNSNRRASGAHQFQTRPPDLTDITLSSASLLSPATPFSHERSGSRMSGESGTGGANDNSSLSSAGGGGGNFPNEVFTSTPKSDMSKSPSTSSVIQHSTPAHEAAGKTNFNSSFSASLRPSGENGGQYLTHKRLSGDDWRSSSQESSPYASTSRMNIYAAPTSTSSPRDPAAVASSSSLMPNSYTAPSLSSHLNNHNYHPGQVYAGNLNVNNNNRNNPNLDRELPPVPTDPPPPIPAADRLDRLTMLSSSRDPTFHSQQVNSVQNLSPNSRDEEVVMRRPGPTEPGRRTSHGPFDRHHPASSSINTNSGLLPDQFQPPVPRSQPPVNSNPGLSKQQKNEDNSVVSGHNPSRPPANLMPGQNNNHHPFPRARPASAMGASPHIRGVISRPPGEGRPRQQPLNQQQHQQARGLSNEKLGRGALSSNAPHNSNTNNSQNQPERPKSVPPHMFHPASREEAVEGNQYPQKQNPVPPPRRTSENYDFGGRESVREAPEGHEPQRDGRSSGVSLLREPSRSSSRGPPSSGSPGSQPSSHAPNNSNKHQQPSTYSQHHQQSSQNMAHTGRPSSQSNLDHQLQTQTNSSNGQFNSSSMPSSRPSLPRQPRPTGVRPESLNLAGSRGQPPPRSHSSIGQPTNNFMPSGPGPYNRSTTPGPHPSARRDSGPSHENYHIRDPQERQLSDPGQRLPPPGAQLSQTGQGPYSAQRRQNYSSASSDVSTNRPSRACSLPVDPGPHGDSIPPESRRYSQPYTAPSPGSQQHYSDRQSLQYQQQRVQSSPGVSSSPAANGPYGGSNSTAHHQHSNPSTVHPGPQPHPRQAAQVTPQIRSQGRSNSNVHLNANPPPPVGPSNRQVGNPASLLSSPLSEHAEQNSSGPPLGPNKVASGSVPATEEQPEVQGQTKNSSSIWYEYGCV